MAYYNDVVKTNDVVERVLGMSANLLKTLAERRARRRVFAQTRDELMALSNRELADLGIARAEIKRIAWESAQDVTAH